MAVRPRATGEVIRVHGAGPLVIGETSQAMCSVLRPRQCGEVTSSGEPSSRWRGIPRAGAAACRETAHPAALRSCGHWLVGVTRGRRRRTPAIAAAGIRRHGRPTARRAAARGGRSGAVIKSPGLPVGFFGVAKREPAAPCRFRAITVSGPMFGQAQVEASRCVRGSSCGVPGGQRMRPWLGGGPTPRLSCASPKSIGLGEMPPTDGACRRGPRPLADPW